MHLKPVAQQHMSSRVTQQHILHMRAYFMHARACVHACMSKRELRAHVYCTRKVCAAAQRQRQR